MSKEPIGYEPRRTVVKKSGFLGKLVALLLGFVLGVVAVVGGVVGVGYWAISKPIKEVDETLVDKLAPDFDLSQYIGASYYEGTVLDLFSGASAALSSISAGTGTLNTLNELSPYVSTFVKGSETEYGLVDYLSEYGIKVDGDELMSKLLVKTETTEELDEKYLTDYLLITINQTSVGDLLTSFGYELNPLLFTLCYGVEGEDYEKNEKGEVVMLEGKTALTLGGFVEDQLMERLAHFPLETIMSIDTDDAIMCTLAYGAEHRYEIDGDEVKMLPAWYTFDGTSFFDDNGEKQQGTFVAIENKTDAYTLTLTDGEIVYLQKGANGKYYQYKTAELTEQALFSKTSIMDLSDDALALVDEILLKDALHIDASAHPVLLSLAYGEKDVDYRIFNGKIEMLNGAKPRNIGALRTNSTSLINEISLSDVLAANADNTLIMYLLYGKEGIHYEYGILTDNKAKMLPRRVAISDDGYVFNEYGEQISGATVNATNKTYTVGDVTYGYVTGVGLGTLTGKLTQNATTLEKQAQLYYVTDAEGNALYYHPTTLGDLGSENSPINNLTSRLALGDIIKVDDNKFLKHLADCSIDEIPAAINGLTVAQVFEADVYLTCTGLDKLAAGGEFVAQNGTKHTVQTDDAGNYYVDGNNKTVREGNYIDGAGNLVSEENKVLSGTWYYLLTDSNAADGTTAPDEYTVMEMTALMNNMSTNVQKATLNQLVSDGIVDADPAILTEPIHYQLANISLGLERFKYADGTEKQYFGELTLYEITTYMSHVVTHIPEDLRTVA